VDSAGAMTLLIALAGLVWLMLGIHVHRAVLEAFR